MSVTLFTLQDSSTVAQELQPASISYRRVDDTSRTTAEDQSVAVRPRDTKVRRVWTLEFPNREQSDADLIEAMEGTVRCSAWFTWTPPTDYSSTTKTVRLREPVTYNRGPLYVSMTLVLEEV